MTYATSRNGGSASGHRHGDIMLGMPSSSRRLDSLAHCSCNAKLGNFHAVSEIMLSILRRMFRSKRQADMERLIEKAKVLKEDFAQYEIQARERRLLYEKEIMKTLEAYTQSMSQLQASTRKEEERIISDMRQDMSSMKDMLKDDIKENASITKDMVNDYFASEIKKAMGTPIKPAA
eukprot:jgi/Mesvir1/21056/Mv16545-RA.1